MKQTPSKNKKRTAHIVSHTHWDREWRYPIWETQLMLIDFMDELVDVLESGKYPGFLLDGQVIPVLDYLELRPEMTERVKALIVDDKLQVGPWFLLPDEYPIDGESMVRNLLWGRRRAEALGRVFNVGYTAFGWGQTAQLPQLYAGFDIEVAMVGKKVSKHRAPDSEFLWRGPDGSELLSTRFGSWGRHNFYFMMHLSALFGLDHTGPEWTYNWDNAGIAYHRADREQMEQDHFRLDRPERWYPDFITPEMVEEVWNTTDESVLDDDRLMMNGCDYTSAQPMFPEMVRRLNEIDTDSDRHWVHTTMGAFVDLMRSKIDRSRLAVVEGELRGGPALDVTGNALATRMHIKRRNKQAQNLLIRFAEPLAGTAALAGAPFPKNLIDKAWDFLLKSHPHDSINGVTQDKTALDVSNRLDQVVDIAQAIANRAMQELVRRIDMSGFNAEDVLITVFNPLPYPRCEVIEAWINMPRPEPNYFLEGPLNGLQMFDADGAAVGTQWAGMDDESYPVAEIHTRAFPFHCVRHRVFFETGEIPAGGYKIFRAAPIDQGRLEGVLWADSEARTNTILKTPHVLENDYLRVEMNPNGTFDMTDKGSSHTYRNLNYYEDRGEMGNYWVNERPRFDQAHTSLGCAARIWAEETGPIQATLVSEVTMLLPRRALPPQQQRSGELIELTIRTAVTLRAGAHQVEVNVEFENRHEDHYLRVMFPSGITGATHADAGGHFIVDHRSIRPQGPTPDSVWPDMATLPQNNFVDVSDGKVGIAFLNDSFTEYEVIDNDERTVALSLLRSVKNWICTERVGSDFPSQKGGQSFGRHTARYAIRPHAGTWRNADIPLAAELFNVPPCPAQTRTHAGVLPAGQASLFAIDNPKLCFSVLKKAEDRDSFIMRFYNPTDQRQKGNLHFDAPVARAWLTNLNEDRKDPIKLTDENTIPVTAEPLKIVTVEIEAR